jgi:hypothetical protein
MAADTADTALMLLTRPAADALRLGEPMISGREWRESERLRSRFESQFFIDFDQTREVV